MYIGQPLEHFIGNTEVSAEFVASTVLRQTGRSLPRMKDAISVFEEFDEGEGIVDPQHLPDKTIDFMAVNGIIQASYAMLDADATEQYLPEEIK